MQGKGTRLVAVADEARERDVGSGGRGGADPARQSAQPVEGGKGWLEGARVLAVIPAYNEEANIAAVVRELDSLGFCDILVVDDGSTDATCAVARAAGAECLDLPCNLGIGGAVQSGYKYASANGYDVAFQFDGDGQHDARCVRNIIEPVLGGHADLVVGSRFLGGENEFMSTIVRQVGIRFLSSMLKLATGSHVRDVTSGFRAAGRRCIDLFAHDYPVDYPEPESLSMVLAQGMRVCEVPVSMRERSGGSSSISGLAPLYYMVKVSIAVVVAARGARKMKKRNTSVASCSEKEGC